VFGVYVHIPFCARRCDYCAFATWTDRIGLAASYVDACRREVDTASLPPATSVFFGGGTPSLLPAPLLLSVLRCIPLAPGAEVTVECNPETVSAELLAAYRAGGVTRVSFGVQSMVPSVLAGLGRVHSVGSVEAAVSWAVAAGFETWNADLIFGGHGESDRDWRRSLEAVLQLGAPHLSAYALTVEPGTPLSQTRERWPDDDVLADRYLVACSVLEEAGLANYEISNWARPGHECRHNLLYWRQGSYRGIGCAAQSHQDGRRWWNVRTPDRYIAAIGGGGPVVAGSEQLAPAQRRREALELALRTRDGVPVGSFGAADAALLRERGLVEAGGAGLVLTRQGRLLANEVAIRLAAA
jgi:putative oxygen-independent coproporphyrinogen III oxidase